MRGATVGTRGQAVAAVLVASLAIGAGHAGADDASWSKAGSIREALQKLGPGRTVELVLGNGKSYKGKLGPVGEDTVLVTELAGKELFDALIELDDVSAIEVRARGGS